MKFCCSKKKFIVVPLMFIFLMPLLFIRCFRKQEHSKLETEKYVEVIKGIEFEMIRVDGGIFKMGCSDKESELCDNDELPEHLVKVNSFYIGKFEVTQDLWRAVMFGYPLCDSCCPDCPVEMVSCDDANSFIKKLNLYTGKNYRLPTEAEWEYAAGGGRKSGKFVFSGSNIVDSVAWCWKNSLNKTHPVGQKMPNELGICDMSGNVWEWCSDWYGEYESSFQINPDGPTSGSDKILRGGCLTATSKSCSVCERGFGMSNFRNPFNGFRLALDE
jgi:formylglycine-generating enzyme required for sulfatase activity